MRKLAKRIGLGLTLILSVSSVLLFSDWVRRGTPRRLPRVALLQFSSYRLIDDAVDGVLEGMRRKSFEDGRSISLQRFNAQGDLPTLNSIAHAIVDARFDLVVTVSTPALQAMAGANREGKIRHVFGAVTDPFLSGVGLKRENPLDHPPHLVGIGTFQPVRETFLLARKVYPGLRLAGTVWNPAETCSQACVQIARATARELGVQLMEAQVESSSAVLDAANSLVARGVQAFFVGGDNTVEAATQSVIKAAAQGHVPVLTYEASWVERGAFLGLGADYAEVGRIIGGLAADILGGRDTAKVAIADVVPKRLGLNLPILASLRDPWRVPPEVRATAATGFDERGLRLDRNSSVEAAAAPAALAKKWKIHLVELVNAPAIEESRKGVLAGLRDSGLAEGRDYEIRLLNAQGDMAMLNSLIDAAVTAQADMIYTITTPALQAAMNKVRDRPLLFALALDPLLVGDTGSHATHRANVAGIYDRSPFEEMVQVIRQCMPQARAIGTLFAPAEANSVNFRDELAHAARRAGLELVAVPSTSSADVPDAALALTGRGIHAICQINDNLNSSAFPSLVAAAQRARVPIFGFETGQARTGAALVLSNDHFDGGRESGLIAAQVIRGASPGQFPYKGITRTRLIINRRTAAAVHLSIPDPLLRRAEVLE